MKLGRAQSTGVVDEPVEDVSESTDAPVTVTVTAAAGRNQPDRTEERQPATS
jgi:hypothetical protein